MSIHLEGFEQFSGETTELNNALFRADYLSSGPWAIVAGRMPNSFGIAGRQAKITRQITWATGSPTMSIGFSHMFDARGSVAYLKFGTKTVHLWMHPDTGVPMLNDTAGGSIPSKQRWYFIEIEVDRVSGAVRLYINGRLDGNANVGAIQTVTAVEVGLGYTSPAVYRPLVTPVPFDNAAKTYDDFYIRDLPRTGPLSISTRMPSIATATGWFRADPTESHAEAVSHRPPKPLDNYIASDTIDSEEIFRSDDPLANTNPVIFTGVVVLARKSDLLNAQMEAFIGVNANWEFGARTLTTNWRTQYVCFEHSGDDAPADILFSQFGVKVKAP